MEIWKEIPGYEGLYEVSNTGFIRSLDRFISNGSGHKRLRKGRIIKMWPNSKGYMRCQLSYNNDKKNYFVHRLVIQTFIPNPDNLPEVNHKDEDKTNNRVDNLEWCDKKYNVNYGMSQEKRKCTKIKLGQWYGLDKEDNKLRLREYSKKWYIDNIDRIKEYHKEYYQNHKDKWKNKRKEDE